MSFAPTNQTPTAAGGTGKSNTNQPAPFGVAAGGGNGGGKYGQMQLPGELTNAVNNIMPAINDTVNHLDQYAQQMGPQQSANNAQTNFLTGGATPAAGGGKYGKTGPMSDQQQATGQSSPMDMMNRYNSIVYGSTPMQQPQSYNLTGNFAPTQHRLGAAMPTPRPAVGAPQPFSPTRQVGRALPGQPSTMPVAAPRLPAPVKLAPLQPNFRTGGVRRV